MRRLKIASCLSLLGLITLVGVYRLFLNPISTPTFNILWMLVEMSPLALALVLVTHGKLVGSLATTVIGLLYFIRAILLLQESQTHLTKAAASLELFLAMAVVLTSTYLIRELQIKSNPNGQ